jgi:YfiH family protein
VSGKPGLAVVQIAALAAQPGVMHGFSERRGGVSTGPYASLNLGPRSGDDADGVRANRHRFLTALGLEGVMVLAPRQVHSADVTVVRADAQPPAGTVLPGDAVVSDARGVALMVLAADCVPILISDPRRGVVAAVHAGWRGTAGGIAARAVETMRQAFACDPGDITVALGPSIGRCCYEVGPEVLTAVGTATPAAPATLYDPLSAGKGRLDLVAANIAQLRGAGVPSEQTGASGLCTVCHVARFFSHRREGEPTGRGGAVIALAP